MIPGHVNNQWRLVKKSSWGSPEKPLIEFLAILKGLNLLSLSADWAEILHVMFCRVYKCTCEKSAFYLHFENLTFRTR